MRIFYVALGIFVSTSVSIGIVSVLGGRYYWLPVVIGLSGACFLFYGSILLIYEARLALATIRSEMDFLWKLGKHFAPAELTQQYSPHHMPFSIRSHKDKRS